MFITICFTCTIGFFVSIICIKKNVPDLSKTFLIISRIAASICLLVMITMIADLGIPKQILDVTVSKQSASMEVSFGIYKEKLTTNAYDIIRDGEMVQIHVSRIYDEIKQITLIDDKNLTLNFPKVDCYAFIFMMWYLQSQAYCYLKDPIKRTEQNSFGFVSV